MSGMGLWAEPAFQEGAARFAVSWCGEHFAIPRLGAGDEGGSMGRRRLTALLMTALLALGLCPALAFADEAQPAAGGADVAAKVDDPVVDAGKDDVGEGEGDKDGGGEEKPKPEPVSLAGATLTLAGGTTFEYTGRVVEPAVTVKLDDRTLAKDVDYRVDYTSNLLPGTGVVSVVGVGDYDGIKTTTFAIKRSAGNEVALPGSWVKNARGWWYKNSDGTYPVSCWRVVDGARYWFDASGYMATGWLSQSGKWYLLAGSGAMVTGWANVGGTWYHFGANADDAKTYGVMATGWLKLAEGWYYLAPSGAMASGGWKNLGGTWYYLGKSGLMATGWVKDAGKWYYLKDSGAMAVGWAKDESTWYYLEGSGAMATGWKNLGGTWYYLQPSGAMATGWLKLGGTWYYLKESGAMATGWLKLGKTSYYLEPSGAMATGWKSLGGNWYYLQASGARVENAWIGSYFLGADGAMVKSRWVDDYWVGADGKWVLGYKVAGTGSSAGSGSGDVGSTKVVWWSDKDHVAYHLDKGCQSLVGATGLKSGSADDARAAGKTRPCALCSR